MYAAGSSSEIMWPNFKEKEKLSYTPTYWVLLFCVGGYAVSTHLLTKVLGVSYLQSTQEVVFYVGL